MSKKELTRDYTNYDYVFATVKKKNFEELKAHYKTLGWEDIEEKEDATYYDIVHIFLRRPHKIAHKDELQLMQVHLESAWNTIGKYGRRHCPKAIAFGVIFSVISVALIVLGLLSAFNVLAFMPQFYGYILTVLGAAAAVVTVIVSLVICRKEIKCARLKRLTAEEEIDAICARAEQLLHAHTPAQDIAGQAVTEENFAEAACE